MYEPLKVFTYIGLAVFGGGFVGFLRFVYYFFQNEAFRHIASLIVAAVLMIVGIQIVLIGLLADMNSGKRPPPRGIDRREPQAARRPAPPRRPERPDRAAGGGAAPGRVRQSRPGALAR